MSIETALKFIEQEHVLQNQPQVYVVTNTPEAAIGAQEKIERKGGMRLTNMMRQSIMDKVSEFKFEKAGKALEKRRLALGHRAMVAIFGKTALEQLAKIGPPYAYAGHTNEGDKFTADDLENWKGNPVTFRLSNGQAHSLPVKDPIPLHIGYNHTKFFVVKSTDLSDQIIQLQDDIAAHSKERNQMAIRVNAVLNSVTTYTSLQKTWPDGERFYKHLPIDFPFRNQVPAVRVEELNDALGI